MALSLAASTAAAAYLDAKFHIRKDFRSLYALYSARKQYEKAVAQNRRSLFYLFEQQVQRIPNEPCIWARETGDVTYAQVFSMVNRYANWMKDEMGVRPGELVAFYLMNSLEMLVAVWATWALGAAPSMINYNLSGKGLVHCLSMGAPRVLLVDADEGCQARIRESRGEIEKLGLRTLVLDRGMKDGILRSSDERVGDEWRSGVVDDDPTILLFTSGTTGFPKACKYPVSRVWQSVGDRAGIIGSIPNPNGTRFYDPMPYYHGTGFTVTLMCLTYGMTVCVGRKFSAKTFWEDIRDSRATAFVYVGETARYLLAQPPSPRDRDHNVQFMFGNGLRPDVWEKFQERFGVEKVSEFFNSTEGVLSLAVYQSRGPFFATAVGHHGLLVRSLFHRTIIPVATSSEDNSIIRDPQTGFAKRAPYATGGEVLVRVPSEKFEESGFIGYYQNDEATQKRFARDVFEKGDIFYRSGDALRRDEHGRWYFLDRLGDTFRWKSENVSTAEVADSLGRFPGVVEANVYGVLVPGYDGRAGCAAIFLNKQVVDSKGGEVAFFRELLAYARQKLPRYAIPVFLRIVGSEEAGPQMHNNKQNKVPLREEGVDLERIARGMSPQDRMFWTAPGRPGYEPFTSNDWQRLKKGREGGVRL